MENFIGVFIDMATAAFVYTKNKVSYVVHYRRNLRSLDSLIEKLEEKRTDIDRAVTDARSNQQELLNEVVGWLKRVEQTIIDVRNLELEAGVEKKWGVSPNMKHRYVVSKKAIKLKNVVEDLCAQKFDKISRPPPIPKAVALHTDYMEGLGSVERVKKEILEALADEKVQIVCVQGMGGVGKSTLMRKINNELITIDTPTTTDLQFNKVIMVTVPDVPEPTRTSQLQDAIAARLGLELAPTGEVYVRATRLHTRLIDEGKVLIILDDVWDDIKLRAVGIPTETNTCKIVLTTRGETVCRAMGATKTVKMHGLDPDEAWELFRARAGDSVDLQEVEPVARKVCAECGGLPLAITVVGKTLKDEEKRYVWNDSLQVLKSSDVAQMHDYKREVINSLRLSYDRLPSETHKLCFLYCCLFPPSHVITAQDVICYGLGERFLKGDTTLWDASLTLIKTLKGMGLLMNVGSNSTDEYELDMEWSGRMHDVVRGLAMHIATTEGQHAFYVEAGKDSSEWPDWEVLNSKKRISVMNNTIASIPIHTDPSWCSNVRSLLLQNNSCLEEIRPNFFVGMEEKLVVLDLNGTGITSLPMSIGGLKRLRTLNLSHCFKLRLDGELIARLANLTVLNLRGVRIKELPKGFKDLIKLRILDISFTGMEVLHSGVLSRFVNLEQLNMLGGFDRWEVHLNGNGNGNGNGKSLAEFSELICMNKLKYLHVSVRNVKVLTEEVLHSEIWRNLASVVVWADPMVEVSCTKCRKVIGPST